MMRSDADDIFDILEVEANRFHPLGHKGVIPNFQNH